MTNICPNSGCDALYDLAEGDVGRSFECRKCGAMLLIEQGGLRVLSRWAERAPPAETYPPRRTADRAPADPFPPRRTAEPRPMPSSSESNPMRPLTQSSSIASAFFTVLFGVGTCFVVLFMFLPLLDVTRELARKAAIDAGDQRIHRLFNPDSAVDPDAARPAFPPDVNPDKDKPNDKSKSGGLSDAEKKAQKDAWDKTKKGLQDDVDETHIYARQAMHVYTWGMLFGFLCLAVASVGFLSPNETTTRRVLGVIVLAAQVVFIFMYCMYGFIFASARNMFY